MKYGNQDHSFLEYTQWMEETLQYFENLKSNPELFMQIDSPEISSMFVSLSYFIVCYSVEQLNLNVDQSKEFLAKDVKYTRTKTGGNYTQGWWREVTVSHRQTFVPKDKPKLTITQQKAIRQLCLDTKVIVLKKYSSDYVTVLLDGFYLFYFINFICLFVYLFIYCVYFIYFCETVPSLLNTEDCFP
jgi:hypothetical protein